MNYFRSLLECLLIVLFRTAGVHLFPFSGYVFDPAVPYVLFLGLFGPARSAFFHSLALGLLMDGVSGAPFGVYTSTYLWITAALQQMIAVLRVVDTFWMIRLLAGLGVLFESTLLLGVTVMVHPRFTIPVAALERIGVQAFLAALMAPALFSLFHWMRKPGESPQNGQDFGMRNKRWQTISRA